MRRFAYADPPYPGQAKSRYGGAEVNHRLLIAYLDEFDGWALSTSASALLSVWTLAPHARCAAWTKTWAKNGWSRVRWSWEPVLFVTPDRALQPGEWTDEYVYDSLVCGPVNTQRWQEVQGQSGGSKPYEFVRWVLGLMGYQPGDEFVDVFPGSGAVSRHASVDHEEMFA